MVAARIQRAWDGTKAFGLSVAVHLLAAALIVLGTMDWQPFRPPSLEGLSIEAVIVDMQAIRDAQQEAERAQQRELERERRERELEERRRRELEQKRQEDLRLQQLRAQQERDRQERLKKQQDELERIRQQRAEAERQRKIEEERLKQLDARRQAEAEAQRRAVEQEALREQQARAAQEFRAGQLATKNQEYRLLIAAQVTQNWLRPPTAQPGLRCTLRVVQIPGGEVISANIVGRCNGDEATRRSLVAAVERTGNLPYRGYEDVFDREIDFIFTYDGD